MTTRKWKKIDLSNLKSIRFNNTQIECHEQLSRCIARAFDAHMVRLNISNAEMATVLGISTTEVEEFRSGKRRIPGAVGVKVSLTWGHLGWSFDWANSHKDELYPYFNAILGASLEHKMIIAYMLATKYHNGVLWRPKSKHEEPPKYDVQQFKSLKDCTVFELDKVFACRFKSVRRICGITQERCGELIDVSNSTISDLEKTEQTKISELFPLEHCIFFAHYFKMPRAAFWDTRPFCPWAVRIFDMAAPSETNPVAQDAQQDALAMLKFLISREQSAA